MTKGIKMLFLLLILASTVVAQKLKEITVEDIYRYKFYEGSVYGINWMNDGKYYSSLSKDKIYKINVTTGKSEGVIFDGTKHKISFSAYSFSADEKKILVQSKVMSIYRRSFTAEYYVYDVNSSSIQKLSPNGAQSYATFSPDGSKVAFARKNNLFYVDLKTMKETQVTTDGKFNHIINGSSDWVYEEEFAFAKAFFWSPKGDRLAFYRFNETEVREYNMQKWPNQLYPVDYKFKYPKAGEKNSEIEIKVFDLNSKKVVTMDIGSEKDIYIPRVKWTKDNNVLCIRRMNRLQNQLDMMMADVQSGKTNVILTEKTDTYVDINYTDDLIFLENGNEFLYTSEKDGYKHLYLCGIDGKEIRQITKGKWEVSAFHGLDKENGILYYSSTEESPLERDFYKINIKGKKKEKLSTSKGTTSVNLSPDFKYYISYFSNVSTPKVVRLMQVEGNKELKVLEDNARLKKTLSEYDIVAKELFVCKARDGVKLNGYILKPSNLDKNNKYPVLMHVYGGPGSQKVTNSWGDGLNYFWHQMLVQKGYIVVCVDNRGTDGRGKKFKTMTYANLGKYEVMDQVDAAKYLSTLGYVDSKRIGIWGWSYGGYMSSLCMTVGADVFKAGIAVAPVTTWRYYDSIYTERFLKRPQDNAKGYDENSPINHV